MAKSSAAPSRAKALSYLLAALLVSLCTMILVYRLAT